MEKAEFIKQFQNYDGIAAVLRNCTHQEIVLAVAELASVETEVLEGFPMGMYVKGQISVVYSQVLDDLICNIGFYDWVYERLADDISRNVFTRLLQYRLFPDRHFLRQAAEVSENQTVDRPVLVWKDAQNKVEIAQSEVSAIIDLKNKIKNERPKLAVCLSHGISDIWQIPKLLDSINPGYQLYLRCETEGQKEKAVLYAIQEEKDRSVSQTRTKKVIAMAPYDRGWSNVELIKDCGLIPYLMYKNYGYEVSMVGANGGPYPYHEKYTKGVKMEFLSNGQVIDKIRYMEQHGKEIDGLLLRGCYATNFMVAKVYKLINPKGRIYVGLDANSGWMDRIIWDDKDFVEFMDCCDVIATSCTAMQKHLNEKWPWKIEHIPNGWYDFAQQQRIPVYEEKENIILTVGRLGTQQKATEILLEAFAKIADKVPDWKVRLVGNVETGFEEYNNAYFKSYPRIAGRVQFVGAITDREKLALEYRKAKVFALPSEMEGGTPNVIAEALYGGCVTAVARFDAFEEATDFGRCGLSAGIRDVNGFAEILLDLCTNKSLKRMSEHAYQYARSHFDMENIVARVNEMLFGGM